MIAVRNGLNYFRIGVNGGMKRDGDSAIRWAAYESKHINTVSISRSREKFACGGALHVNRTECAS